MSYERDAKVVIDYGVKVVGKEFQRRVVTPIALVLLAWFAAWFFVWGVLFFILIVGLW